MTGPGRENSAVPDLITYAQEKLQAAVYGLRGSETVDYTLADIELALMALRASCGEHGPYVIDPRGLAEALRDEEHSP